MNREHEAMKFLIDMLTGKGIQETLDATKPEILLEKILPIVTAIIFVIHGSSSFDDFQEKYPNERIERDNDYYKEQEELRQNYRKLRDMQFDFTYLVGSYAENLRTSIEMFEYDDAILFNVKKEEFIKYFQVVHHYTMQNLQLVK